MRLFAALLALVLTTGCAVDLREPSAQLATQYAVMKWIDKADDPVVRAHRVLDIAEALEADPGMVPVDGLREAVLKRVEGFAPADQMLAVSLADMLVPYVSSRDTPTVALSDLAILLRRAARYYL
jgi:hypothetical protein